MSEAIAVFMSPFLRARKGTCASPLGVIRENRASASVSQWASVEKDAKTEPLTIGQIRCGSRRFLVRKGYLELFPTYDETGNLLCLEYTPLGIHVFAESREELCLELAEQICLLWDEYACEDEEKLSPAAIQLKRQLLADLEEVQAW